MFLAILAFLVLPSTPCGPELVDLIDVVGGLRGNNCDGDDDFHAKGITDISLYFENPINIMHGWGH